MSNFSINRQVGGQSFALLYFRVITGKFILEINNKLTVDFNLIFYVFQLFLTDNLLGGFLDSLELVPLSVSNRHRRQTLCFE